MLLKVHLPAAFALVCLSAPYADAKPTLTLGGLFGDGVVLQQNQAVPIWGVADPRAVVTVHLGGQTKTTAANRTGNWEISFDPMKASKESTTLTVHATAGGESVERVVKDVLVGEVWICCGQSNMEMRLAKSSTGQKELAGPGDRLLRFFDLPKRPAQEPLTDLPSGSGWVAFDPAKGAGFSAMAYFTAKGLRQDQPDVPVGVIVAAWSGAAGAAWLSPQSLDSPELRAFLPRRVYGWMQHHQPSALFDGMIAPIVPYAVAGVVYYQGETDGTEPKQNPYYYRDVLRNIVLGWRQSWARSDLPFYIVQLPNGGIGTKEWPAVREGQAEILKLPATGVITTLDIGSDKLLHPLNKQDFGERMARLIIAKHYGRGSASFPTFKAASHGDGAIRVEFDEVGGSLKTTDGAVPTGFAVAGADGIFQPAEAKLDGNAAVVLRAAGVGSPTMVRYAWEASPKINLVSGDGLPARPFRTDTLPLAGQQFGLQALPAKALLAVRITGEQLAADKSADWVATSDESDTLSTLKILRGDVASFMFRDLPGRKGSRFNSPTLFWTTRPEGAAKAFDPAKGATAAVVIDMPRATQFDHCFDLEIGLKQADGKLRRYTTSIFPMEVRATLGTEVRYLATNLDNTRDYHQYRIAVRPDGVGQVYFDDKPIGVLSGDVVEKSTIGGGNSYVLVGKTSSSGDMVARVASASFDAGGAFAPVVDRAGLPARGEDDEEPR